jgi:hypothetical protein
MYANASHNTPSDTQVCTWYEESNPLDKNLQKLDVHITLENIEHNTTW